MKVVDIMNPNVITVKPDTTVRECIKVLRENKISGVPVVTDQRARWHRNGKRHTLPARNT